METIPQEANALTVDVVWDVKLRELSGKRRVPAELKALVKSSEIRTT